MIDILSDFLEDSPVRSMVLEDFLAVLEQSLTFCLLLVLSAELNVNFLSTLQQRGDFELLEATIFLS